MDFIPGEDLFAMLRLKVAFQPDEVLPMMNCCWILCLFACADPPVIHETLNESQGNKVRTNHVLFRVAKFYRQISRVTTSVASCFTELRSLEQIQDGTIAVISIRRCPSITWSQVGPPDIAAAIPWTA